MPEKGSSVRWQRDLMRCLGTTLVAGMGHLALAGTKDVPGSLGVGNMSTHPFGDMKVIQLWNQN